MRLLKRSDITVGCLVSVLFLGAARTAAAPFILITPGQLRVPAGGIRALTVTCTDCDFPPVGGRIDMSIDNTSIATVDPREVFLFQNPAITAINVTGVSEGGTILRVRLFRGFETIPLLEAVATITVSPGFACPVPTLVETEADRDDLLLTLRRFRDEVLLQSPAGRAYTEQFYRHAFEVSLILSGDLELREQAREALLISMPIIEAAANGERALLTAEDRAAIDVVLDGLEADASPQLQRAIHGLRLDLHSGKRLRALGIEVDRGR